MGWRTETIAEHQNRIDLLEEANRRFRSGAMTYRDMGPPEVDLTDHAIAKNEQDIERLRATITALKAFAEH